MTPIQNSSIDLVVVLGPTATGKTQLAVQIADAIDSEIISADSRQVYRKMDIGTGKDLSEYKLPHRFIPFHLIDILDPQQDHSVFDFQRNFYPKYQSMLNEGKCPVLCGGTGLYIESVLLGFKLCPVPPDESLRAELSTCTIEDLREKLLTLKPEHHNTSDLIHRKRLIRAIEIAVHSGVELEPPVTIQNPVVLGVTYPRDEVKKRITSRLKHRLELGMIEEVRSLLDSGITFERLNYFGLEYRFIGQHLAGKLSWNDMFQKLNTAIHQFSKRQMTFFRHMEKRGIVIHWIPYGNFETAIELINARGKP
ncbi:MAG: tRNA (adenosine(37)-N6)-dimethylallyltransferase MiaA [Candidatus Marinimicrobia bacterium]|nr:tRNA (adenosine(37)-N6)-dimethylallyltransferase MiaA [Candidatus Neomarinimicrobiota bacterium]